MLDSVVCVLRSVAHYLQSQGGVVEVLTVLVEMFKIIFEEKFVLGKSLDRFQHEVLQFQVLTPWEPLKLFYKLPKLGISLTDFVKVEVHS